MNDVPEATSGVSFPEDRVSTPQTTNPPAELANPESARARFRRSSRPPNGGSPKVLNSSVRCSSCPRSTKSRMSSTVSESNSASRPPAENIEGLAMGYQIPPEFTHLSRSSHALMRLHTVRISALRAHVCSPVCLRVSGSMTRAVGLRTGSHSALMGAFDLCDVTVGAGLAPPGRAARGERRWDRAGREEYGRGSPLGVSPAASICSGSRRSATGLPRRGPVRAGPGGGRTSLRASPGAPESRSATSRTRCRGPRPPRPNATSPAAATSRSTPRRAPRAPRPASARATRGG